MQQPRVPPDPLSHTAENYSEPGSPSDHDARTAVVPAPPSVSSAAAAPAAPTRLYVGNLAASVDEYALLKAFQRFGKLKKLDFLFHNSGPQRGQPRGYAFIEYEQASDAAAALKATTSRAGATLRGRRLAVAYASQRPEEEPVSRTRRRLAASDDHRTALSTTLAATTPSSVEGRIAQMEAQLASIDKTCEPSDSAQSRGVGAQGRSHPSRHLSSSARNSAHPYQRPSPGHLSRPSSGS